MAKACPADTKPGAHKDGPRSGTHAWLPRLPRLRCWMAGKKTECSGWCAAESARPDRAAEAPERRRMRGWQPGGDFVVAENDLVTAGACK
jgi:hypothetical protein